MKHQAAQRKLYEILDLGCWHEFEIVNYSETRYSKESSEQICVKHNSALCRNTDLTTNDGFLDTLLPAMQKHESWEEFMVQTGCGFKAFVSSHGPCGVEREKGTLPIPLINPQRFFEAVCSFFEIEVK